MCIRDRFTVIMILDVSGRIMGLIVDAVSDVITLNKEDIKPCLLYTSPEPTRLLSISYAVFCLKKKKIRHLLLKYPIITK
mgnify:CR=1 FL=1